jgi:hypothetical protein
MNSITGDASAASDLPANPGGEWVDINDLPEPTRKALWERDGRKLVFPYGLHPDDDVINRPPAVKVNEGSRVPEQEGQ